MFTEYERKLIGMGTVHFHKREKMKHNAFFSSLFVLKEFRGKGIGKALIEKRIEEVYAKGGIKNIICEILETQKLSLELHKKMGFEMGGTYFSLAFIDGNYYDDYVFTKKLF